MHTSVYTATKGKYSDIPIQLLSLDIRNSSQQIERHVNDVGQRIGKRLGQYSFLSARLRDSILLELEERLGYCLVDTLNMTEHILGEFTTGIGTHHFPVFNFYKSMLYEIARLIDLPEWIRTKRPVNGATGRDKLIDYFGEIPPHLAPQDVFRVLDPVLYRLYTRDYSFVKVAKDLGHPTEFTKRVEEWINGRGISKPINSIQVWYNNSIPSF